MRAWRDARPVAIASSPELPQALVAALATEIKRAASQARAEVEAALVAEQADSKRLAEDGDAKDAEIEALQAQVAALTTERDTWRARPRSRPPTWPTLSSVSSASSRPPKRPASSWPRPSSRSTRRPERSRSRPPRSSACAPTWQAR
jgi:hypothetical protein